MKHSIILRIIAGVLVVTGFGISYIISRRKFNRRAITGAEQFKSYEKAWITKSLETVLTWGARLLIVAGIVIFILTYA